jgi:sarcosine oxidase gamma subunit
MAVVTEGALVARLATSEFLVEATGAEQERVESARRQVETRQPDVYPVARQDVVIGIDGPETNTLLRQICSVDFASALQASECDAGPIFLTSMIGVGVVAWPRRVGAEAGITLWADPSFAHYLWTTLHEVGRDIGVVVLISDRANSE